MSAVLAFEGVSASAGSREILRGVTLALGEGEGLTLAGPNGAGKTTLFRVASRVLRPTAGSVTLFGRPLAGYPRRELARLLAVVPQDAAIAFPFRVGEIVLMGRTPHLGRLGFESHDDLERARPRFFDAAKIELRELGAQRLRERKAEHADRPVRRAARRGW